MYSIVIADDDIIMLGKIAGYLEKKCEDCVVLAKCINGGSALEAVREYSPDLLILDMDMPDMMGTQVIKTLSDEKIMPSTLVLSNYDNYEFVREAMKYGSYDYLLKHQLPYAIGSVTEEMIESYQLALEKLEEQNLDGLSEYVKDTIAYIDKCYSNDIILETVAKEIHVSPSYLSRLFKREMEMSFTEYLNSFRVKKARQYMEEGEHNLYEISEKTGFNSYNYFLKVYKEYTGLRPSECIQKTK